MGCRFSRLPLPPGRRSASARTATTRIRRAFVNASGSFCCGGYTVIPPSAELQQKLASLASYADEIEDWLAHPPDSGRPRALQRVLERLVQVIVQCAGDAGDLWLAEHGHAL